MGNGKFLRCALAALLGALSVVSIFAQGGDFKPVAVVKLWPAGAPGAMADEDTAFPRLSVFLPAHQTRKRAVLILPGGGYQMLATGHEGYQEAAWLNARGYAAFMLEYRLGPKHHHPVELGDAKRAMRWVRAHAAEYGVDKNDIGVWGFSAGGHLSSSLATMFDGGDAAASDPIDREGCRPAFVILNYPVIGPWGGAAKSSFDKLLGENADKKLVDELTTSRRVTPQTPPTFIVLAADDDAVSPDNSLRYYSALVEAGVPVEMHLYAYGGHGFGMATDHKGPLPGYAALLEEWLQHPERPQSRLVYESGLEKK